MKLDFDLLYMRGHEIAFPELVTEEAEEAVNDA